MHNHACDGRKYAGGDQERSADARRSRKASSRPGEILVRVTACGVCRTDLHVAEGDLAPKHPRIVPGHEVVGVVEQTRARMQPVRPGARVGIAWLRETCGVCAWCRRGRENLCPNARFTGWDHDGGYAEFATVREDFAYAVRPTCPTRKLRRCCARASSVIAQSSTAK